MTGNIRTFILMAAMTALVMGMGYLLGGQGGAVIALVIAGAGNLWAWWNSDKAVLNQQGAMRVTREQAPELVDMVAALANRAGLPMPAVYVLATEQPNAFATGRNPENAAVAVTQGILQTLNRDELAGVIAHELAHIKHRDTLTMTVTATMVGAIAMMGNMMLFTGGRDDRGGAHRRAASRRHDLGSQPHAEPRRLHERPRHRARSRRADRACAHRPGMGAGTAADAEAIMAPTAPMSAIRGTGVEPMACAVRRSMGAVGAKACAG